MVVISDRREQPHFAGIVADRIWHAFWQDSEVSPSALAGRVQESLGPDPVPTAFVAHENEVFLGTASLIVSDQETRPELTPWVAAVWVEPEARRHGTGAALAQFRPLSRLASRSSISALPPCAGPLTRSEAGRCTSRMCPGPAWRS